MVLLRVSDSIPDNAFPVDGVDNDVRASNALVGMALSPLVNEEAEEGEIKNRFEALVECNEEMEVESSVSEGEENLFTYRLVEAITPSITPLQISEPRITRARNNLALEQKKETGKETSKRRRETQVIRGRGRDKPKWQEGWR